MIDEPAVTPAETTMDTVQLPPTRAKGALVWRTMDQQDLDDAYDQSKWAKNRAIIRARRIPLSAETLKHIAPPERHAYGAGDNETLDFYRSDVANAPVAIFIHGGAWREGKASDFAYQAEVFLNAGVNYVALDFSNIEDVNGDLQAMAEQVRRGLAWLWKNAVRLGADPGRLYLMAHSSGAHLGSCALTADWSRYDVPGTIIKAALLCSGMYDLEPVRKSNRSKYVAFTDAIEHELSAMRHIGRLNCPLVLAVGDGESPEFIRQSQDFADAVVAAGKSAQLIVAEKYNHFEIGETLANPYGVLGRVALAMVGGQFDR